MRGVKIFLDISFFPLPKSQQALSHGVHSRNWMVYELLIGEKELLLSNLKNTSLLQYEN